MVNNWVDFWNKFSKENYDYVNYLPGYIQMLNKISKYVGKNKLVLDVGCGTGNLTFKLAKNNHVVGIDISDKMLENARNKLTKHPMVLLRQGNIYSLNFPKNIFDCFVSVNVLYNLDRPLKAIREAHRVLKKGGTLIITSPYGNVKLDKQLVRNILKGVKDANKIKVKQLLEHNKMLIKQGGMKFMPSKEKIDDFFLKNGFNIAHKETIYYGCNYLIKAFKV